jgi:repressor LexA
MIGITEKQQAILNFIEKFMEGSGMAPSVYEIAESFDIKPPTVFAHLRALQRKNMLTRTSQARSISLNRQQKTQKKRPMHMSFMLSIPLLGRINAGLPADSMEYKEGEVLCDAKIIGEQNADKAFALKVHGESMRDMGILADDIVIVKQVENVNAGDVVVALVDNATTVKSFYPADNGMVELRPANDEFEPQFYPAGQIHIQGTVVALQRVF